MKLNINKLKTNKILRLIIITSAFLILCTLSFLLYKELKVPKIEEETVKFYSYTHKSFTEYKVLLKPNSLYSSESLGEGHYYITNYVDEIQNTFNYEFKGDAPADIKGYYEVAAVIEGYTIVEKDHISIWKKKFTIIPKTEFTVNDTILSLTEDVSIKLSEYSAIADAIAEESEVHIPLQLNVFMDVNLKADIDKGSAEAKMAPAIVIPLDTRYFTVTESDEKEVPGSIEEIQKIQIPPDKLKIKIYICGLAALAIMILGLLLFTEPVRKSPFEIKLNRIFKQHGSRLVALSSELLAASIDNCSIVREIEDLVRVSDELGRPIIYEYSEDYKNIVHFYVLDDKRTYLYILRDSMNESNLIIADDRELFCRM